jgi:hypothetical protein
MQTDWRLDPMEQPPITARYVSDDRKVCVMGRWHRRGGCLYLGEIAVLTATASMRFSSTTPTDAAGLAGYATPEYLARHADRFVPRVERYAPIARGELLAASPPCVLHSPAPTAASAARAAL